MKYAVETPYGMTIVEGRHPATARREVAEDLADRFNLPISDFIDDVRVRHATADDLAWYEAMGGRELDAAS